MLPRAVPPNTVRIGGEVFVDNTLSAPVEFCLVLPAEMDKETGKKRGARGARTERREIARSAARAAAPGEVLLLDLPLENRTTEWHDLWIVTRMVSEGNNSCAWAKIRALHVVTLPNAAQG